jgi:hypothetical protein
MRSLGLFIENPQQLCASKKNDVLTRGRNGTSSARTTMCEIRGHFTLQGCEDTCNDNTTVGQIDPSLLSSDEAQLSNLEISMGECLC